MPLHCRAIREHNLAFGVIRDARDGIEHNVRHVVDGCLNPFAQVWRALAHPPLAHPLAVEAAPPLLAAPLLGKQSVCVCVCVCVCANNLNVRAHRAGFFPAPPEGAP